MAAKLSKIGIAEGWRSLDQTELENSLQRGDALIVINADALPRFIDWYHHRLWSSPHQSRFLILSEHYCQNQSLQVAGLHDCSYTVLPETADQLIHYIQRMLGNNGNFGEVLVSSTNNLFMEVINFTAIISITDSDGTITYANDNFCTVSGYRREELLGANHRLLKSGHHDADFYRNLWHTLASGKPWKGYFCNRSKDGKLYWVDSVIHPIFDNQGKLQRYVSVRYNVTDEVNLKERLIKSDERFRRSHEHAHIGTWEWNLSTGELYWSEEIHKLFGYPEPVLETTYENFIAAIHPDDRKLVQQRVDECLNEGREYEVEHRVIHPDSTVHWLSERGHVVHDNDGKPISMLGVVIDVNELKSAQQKAQIAEQRQSAFLSVLTHEVRNPLNAIAGYSRLIGAKITDSELVGYAHKVTQMVDHVAGIISDVNLNTRLEKGQLATNIEPVDIATIVQQSLEIISDSACTIPVQLEELTGRVLADPQHLRQVMVNLLSNAIKYNVSNGTVTVTSALQTNGNIQITVRDTGRGISAQGLETIFEPYERLDLNKSDIEGLGLGLSICKLMVEAMNGKIGVDSQQGVGSTFWIELPLSNNTIAAENDIQPTHMQTLSGSALVLEDNVFNQEFMQAQLETLGLKVTVVNNGVEGLEALQQQHYDVILTDINMPEMGGIEFIEKARNHNFERVRSCPIIVITAADSGMKNQTVLQLSDEVLVKPFALEALTERLEKVLGANQLPSRHSEQQSTGDTGLILNPELMNRYLGKSADRKQRLLKIYLATLKGEIELLKQSFQCHDYPAIEAVAHKLTSSSLSVGAELLYSQLRAISKAIQQQDFDRVSGLMDDLLTTSDRVAAAISLELDETISATGTTKNDSTPQTTDHKFRVLVVDDDAFSLSQIATNLDDFNSVVYQTEINPKTALEHLKSQRYDVIIVDINMPDIDGIQFIRMLSEYPAPHSLAIFSEEKTLHGPVADLIKSYGMRFVGALDKPSTRLDISRLLANCRSHTEPRQPTVTPISDEEILSLITEGGVEAFYQPQVSVRSGKVVCVEALARLRSRSGELIPPALFLHRLESLKLESVFALEVSEQAIRTLASLRELGLPLTMAINFSMQSLEDLSLPEQLSGFCNDCRLKPSDIIIEVTESALSSHPRYALEVLSRMRLKGFTLSIDDFGTGYSSMEKLQKLPFTEMKLDRSYVASASQDDVAKTLLTSSLDLAKKLHMSTVAEGVETQTDLDLVCDLGADLVQGFFFARPLPSNQLSNWIQEFNQHEQ